MPRHTALLVGTVALATGLTVAGGPSQAGGVAVSSPRVVQTHYAFAGSGFGSRIAGGDLPAGSGATAYQHIGCTNRAGLVRTNELDQQDIPGIGRISGLKTRIWTTRHHGAVATHARHRIASLAVVDTPAGSISVTGITSASVASHDATGFHATTTSTVGGITLTPVVGPVQTFEAPTPGNPVSILGLVTFTAGASHMHTSTTGAAASGSALKVEVTASGSKTVLARSHATIAGGVTFGLFDGRSNASRVSAADDSLKSGPQPLMVMPCQGTGGRVHRRSIAQLGLAGQVVVRGLKSRDRSAQTRTRAHGFEMGKVEKVDLGSGAIVVDGVVGRANVVRTAHRVRRDARGTSVGTVTVNGEVRRFPATGIIEVPGVAELRRHLVHRNRSGITVTALRITLLDGSGAVIDLGQARLHVGRLPRHRH
jgi:hypothetical protein